MINKCECDYIIFELCDFCKAAEKAAKVKCDKLNCSGCECSTSKDGFCWCCSYHKNRQSLQKVTTHNCECGSHKIGHTEKGVGHSFWCPMYSNENKN